MMKEGKQAFACDHVNDEHLSLKYPYEQHGFSAAVPVLAVCICLLHLVVVVTVMNLNRFISLSPCVDHTVKIERSHPHFTLYIWRYI